MLLPKKKSKPVLDLAAYSYLLHGPQKIGKSEFASHIADGNILFLCTEPGVKHLSTYDVPVRNWKDAKKALELIEKEGGNFAAVAVDTIALAHTYCTRYACKKMGVQHPSDLEWGKGWDAVDKEFTDWVVRLMTGRGVIFIAHSTEHTIRRRGGGEYTRIEPRIPSGAYRVMQEQVDLWLCADYRMVPKKKGKGEKLLHVLQTCGDDLIVAGGRVPKGVELPKLLPLRYKLFEAAWEGRYSGLKNTGRRLSSKETIRFRKDRNKKLND